MTTLHGVRPTDLTAEALQKGVAEALDPFRESLAADGESPVVLVPDAHYPHHPSTGLVTNPDVVRALAADLVADLGADRVRVGVPASKFIDAERAARYLGYERLAADVGVDVLDLDAAETVERTVHLTKRSRTVDVPAPLAEGTVVCVPTMRRSVERGVESGMMCLAQALARDPVAEDAVAATHACPPTVTLLDGTYVYAGEPRKPRFLAAGDDVVAVSNLAVRLFRVDRSKVLHLDTYEGESRQPTAVRGLDLRAIAESLPRTEPHDPGDDAMMARGYNLYAKVSGDLVPPQLLRGGGDD